MSCSTGLGLSYGLGFARLSTTGTPAQWATKRMADVQCVGRLAREARCSGELGHVQRVDRELAWPGHTDCRARVFQRARCKTYLHICVMRNKGFAIQLGPANPCEHRKPALLM